MSEIVVIGAGPAGCAAAIGLARAGRRVTLLERTAQPRESVCGEFLGGDAVALLRGLGLDLPSLGAVRLTGARAGAGAKQSASALPFEAFGLSRLLLDTALQQVAQEAGVTIMRGATVQGIERQPDGWKVAAHRPRTVVLATGKHSLRGHARAAGPGAVGLKLHLTGLDLPPAVTLLHFGGGYAGLQPGPGGVANLCAALIGAPPVDAAAFLDRVRQGSDLAERLLRDARPIWVRPLAVAGVPYGFRQRGGIPGLYRVGDQVSVIPSFTGDGMAMALASGLAAARAIIGGHGAAEFHADWRRRSASQMRVAAAGAWMMQRLPSVFVGVLGTPLAPMAMRATRVAAGRPGLSPSMVHHDLEVSG